MSIIAAFAVPHPPLIIPQIGRGNELKVEKTINAMKEIAQKIAEIAPETIILTSPHSIMYSDYIHISPGKEASGNFAKFGAQSVQMSVKYDTEFVKLFEELAQKNDFPAGSLGEEEKDLDHGTMVPLYFINQKYKNYKLVRSGLSGLSYADHYKFGKMLAEVAIKSEKKTVIIASGDMSHKLKVEGPYGFANEGPIFDKDIIDIFTSKDFMKLLTYDKEFANAAAECGMSSFVTMAGALDSKELESKVYSYEGVTGVGYGIASFNIKGDALDRDYLIQYLKEENTKIAKLKDAEDEYVKLARLSIETFVKTGGRAEIPKYLPVEMLERKAGVFVSLKKHGMLRGCIGTIIPVKNSVANEILINAISSAADDPRFPPVTENELSELVYSVDVLGETEPIASKNELDVNKYGVIVTSGRKRGLLLPNLDGVDTVEHQISIALSKAGISPEDTYQMERFEVVRHK